MYAKEKLDYIPYKVDYPIKQTRCKAIYPRVYLTYPIVDYPIKPYIP